MHLDYFVQRDVYADDPFTPDVVEASLPAELAVLVRNVGAGDANKVTISSVQPEVLVNEKGLASAFDLKDYALDASALNGATAHLGLNAIPLGTIAPNESKVAQWWLTSSVEGHFIGMSATVTPVNSWNTPDTMLVDPDVGVHKLVRSIVADDDALPDFLVCDDSDLYGTPNEIYTATGEVLPVYVSKVSTVASVPFGAEVQLTVTLTPARSGWNYASGVVSGLSRYTISRIVRGDGTDVPLRNAWITIVRSAMPRRRFWKSVFTSSMHLRPIRHKPTQSIWQPSRRKFRKSSRSRDWRMVRLRMLCVTR